MPLEIPIIGPLLNEQKPLIVGESMWLNPPTPLQWKTIESCVEAQQLDLLDGHATPSEDDDNDRSTITKINLATIDHAPLVAVMSKGGKDYATIAAIVGMVTGQGSSIDTNDAESFRESLTRLRSGYYSDDSRVRLVGIGRARLSDFSNREITFDDGGHIRDIPSKTTSDVDDEDYEPDGTVPEPLFVARMKLLMDSNENEGKSDEYGKKVSPVHALNQLSTLASRIRFLHDDRQRIVRGLQAAQARLEMAMVDWQDWDGIGSIYGETGVDRSNEGRGGDGQSTGKPSNEKFQNTLNKFLHDYGNAVPSSSRPLSAEARRCQEIDNYGLGTSSSAYADLQSVSRVLMERLEPYYSPARLDTEEFEYEAFSWAALQSLQLYLSPAKIAQAVYETTNTCDRLEIVYQAMLMHKSDLNELAQAKSQELLDCGEECTDLF